MLGWDKVNAGATVQPCEAYLEPPCAVKSKSKKRSERAQRAAIRRSQMASVQVRSALHAAFDFQGHKKANLGETSTGVHGASLSHGASEALPSEAIAALARSFSSFSQVLVDRLDALAACVSVLSQNYHQHQPSSTTCSFSSPVNNPSLDDSLACHNLFMREEIDRMSYESREKDKYISWQEKRIEEVEQSLDIAKYLQHEAEARIKGFQLTVEADRRLRESQTKDLLTAVRAK